MKRWKYYKDHLDASYWTAFKRTRSGNNTENCGEKADEISGKAAVRKIELQFYEETF